MSEEAGKTTGVDLNDPSVQAAIQAARQEAKAEAARQYQAQLDEEVKGLKGKNKELLEKLDKTKADRDSLFTKIEASEHGVDHEKLEELAERKAQAKAEMVRRQLSEEMEEKDRSLKKFSEDVSKYQRDLHRERVEKLLARIPGIVPDAFEDLAARLEQITSFETVGGSVVPMFKDENGQPFKGSIDELMAAAREGKGPITRARHMFASAGQGSGTTSNNGRASSSSNWWKMTPEEQTKFVDDHGTAASRELIDKSGPRPQPTQ